MSLSICQMICKLCSVLFLLQHPVQWKKPQKSQKNTGNRGSQWWCQFLMMRVEKNIVLHTLLHVLTALCCQLPFARGNPQKLLHQTLNCCCCIFHMTHVLLCYVVYLLLSGFQKKNSIHILSILYTRIISTFLLIRSSNFKSLQGRREEGGVVVLKK